MKRAAFVLLCLLVAAVAGAEPIRVEAGKTTRVPVVGATAAFSLNATYAEAAAEDGVVIVSGRQPGSTNIVVVTAVGTQTLEVVVVQPPPVYPPGFEEPSASGADSQTASYEFRLSSSPSQQQNVLDATQREGDRQYRVHLANANLLAGAEPGFSAVRFPSLFYEVKTPRREITFLDQFVAATPLTVDNALVRGVHVRDGRWTVHAGYSSVSAFQNLFLPTDREAVLGATYEHRLNPRAALSANVYGFPGGRDTVSRIPGGVVGSLFYEYKRPDDVTVQAEAGVSRGVGFAFRAQKNQDKKGYRHSVRYKSSQFAGLSADSNRGLMADGEWTWPLFGRAELRANYFASRYSLPQFKQTNVGTTWMLRYEASRRWVPSAGFSYGRLKPDLPPGPGVDAASLPLGIEFRSRALTVAYQHMFTRNDGRDRGGHEDRVNVATGWKNWRLAAYWNRQTQAPTADFVVDETPGLRAIIDRLGLTATSVEQIAQLVQQDIVLLQLGYLRAIRLNLAPVRTQAGANVVWSGRGPLAPQVTASYLHNETQLVLGGTTADIGTLSFLCRLPWRMDLFGSWSLYSLTAAGAPRDRRNIVDLSVRRRFGDAPDWLFPVRGAISGRVFEDDEQRGEWRSGDRPFPEVLVVLDGTRQTRTDREGRFRFPGVTSGTHQVEVFFESDRPFYFTTPSRRQATSRSEIDFGVAYATSILVGRVLNDAGAGIPGIQLSVTGGGRRFDTTTDGDGKFTLSGLAPGEYEALPSVDSFPPGYLLSEVAPARAQVGAESPGRMDFTIRAARSIAGVITAYDRSQAAQVPVEGVVVRLRELGLVTTTGKDGAYIFRNLPAGDATVVVTYEGREFVRTERLTPEPTFIRNADINVGAK